ncbi:MAG: tetratricopeptide repeat protein [Terrimicrobiaceae bacterium]
MRIPDADALFKILLIVLATAFVYSPAFHGQWLWDDDSEVTAHHALRTLPGLISIWNGTSSVDYLPLKSTVQWIYFRFAGENPFWWHILNVALHVLNCGLIWRLCSSLGIRQGWLAGLLYAIHPVAVGSVAWISELKNTLSLPFLLSAMMAYIRYGESNRLRTLAASAGFFLLSMLCKSSGVMFPFVILLYSWWKAQGGAGTGDPNGPSPKPFAGIFWRPLLSSIPFFLISLGLGLVTLHFQHTRAIGGEVIPLGGPLSRFGLSGTAAWFYLYKSLMPFRLLPNYPRWDVDPPTLMQLAAWPALAAVFLFFFLRRRTWGRHAFFWLGFFVLNLMPILGFVRISFMRITWTADHFVYISLVGKVVAFAAVADWLYSSSRERARAWLRVLGIAAFSVFIVESHRYAGVFRSEEAMWTFTLQRNPDAWQAHSRLSSVMLRQGNFGASFYHSGEAKRLRPDLPETHNNYSNVLAARGDLAKAIESQRKALELAPQADLFRMNLANLLVRNEQRDEAKRIYRELLDKFPNHPGFLSNYGTSLFYEGRIEESISYFQKALEIDPGMEIARSNLAAAMEARGGPMPLKGSVSGGDYQGVGFLNSDSPLKLFGP